MDIAAFDIGGTSLKMGITNAQGKILKSDSVDIAGQPREKILQEIMNWLKSNSPCAGIAVSTPGYVDSETGFITMGGTIPEFDDFHLKQWLEEKTSLPTSVENDAHCALLAEHWLGKAKQLNDFLMLTIGTGLGGAAFCNGALIRGNRNRAGEFGCLLTSRPKDSDIAPHTMGARCTMTALRENYCQRTKKSTDEISGKDVFDAFDNDDADARKVVDEFYDDLSACLYNLASVFDPQTIFIGGGITERESFLDELAGHLEKYDIDIRIETATYGNDSGMLGASCHFLQTQQVSEK
uniref:ROK family protein n=1 Tax=Pantoea sp. IMH TaxID=1267600 RepID=UPI00046A0C47|nr:ROK family protein [Pantoea sp. IMH]